MEWCKLADGPLPPINTEVLLWWTLGKYYLKGKYCGTGYWKIEGTVVKTETVMKRYSHYLMVTDPVEKITLVNDKD